MGELEGLRTDIPLQYCVATLQEQKL